MPARDSNCTRGLRPVFGGLALRLWAALVVLPAIAAGPGRAAGARGSRAEHQADRDAMVAVIERYGVRDGVVLAAMRSVPRHAFVPAENQSLAYADTPLPIGYGQTISQPFVVAEMTRLLQLAPTSRVLEVGTGSGYQAAVLAEVTPQVFTVEVIRPLAEEAERRLRVLGYETVQVRHADGYHGWAEKGPFDGIVVTCAAGQIPPPLLGQLAPGGRMVIPVGSPFAVQDLMLVTKDKDGTLRSQSLMAVRFVPLTRLDQGPQPR